MSPSALTITADKGFRSGRANVGVKEGSWYFECHILKGGGEGGSGPVVTNHGEPISAPLNAAEALPKGSGSGDGAHVRIGWARREASLNGPCGLDAYSYGIRDSSGEKVTISRPAPYGVPFGSGDVIGCLIHLPNQDELSEEISDIEERERERAKRRGQENDPLDPKRIARKRFPLHYKGQHYFEMVEYPVIKEMENIVARDGRVIEPAIAPGTDVNIGIAVPVKETTRTGSPVKKPKTKAATKNIADGKNGKAVKKGRKTQGTENDGQEDQANRQKELPRLVGSRISFFLNGQPMSPDNAAAFKDILSYLPLRQTEKEAKARAVFEKGTTADALMKQKENPYDDGTLGYYPFISCFGNAKVKFNPGPVWEKPVDPGLWNLGQKKGMDGTDIPIRPRPINERWPEFRLEERCYDEMDDEADMIKLKRFEMEKRKEKRTKPERGTARGGKRTRGTKRGGKVPSSLATEIFERNTPGSSPIPESVGLDQTMSRASTPSNIDYAMDIDHASTQGLGGITEYGIAGGPSYEIE
jgi:COMPASS component BRE2